MGCMLMKAKTDMGGPQEVLRDIICGPIEGNAKNFNRIAEHRFRDLETALGKGADPHLPGEDNITPFLVACQNGMSCEIRLMVDTQGGLKALSSLPSEYLEECEEAYYESKSQSTSSWEFGLTELLEEAVVMADAREAESRGFSVVRRPRIFSP